MLDQLMSRLLRLERLVESLRHALAEEKKARRALEQRLRELRGG